MIERKGGYEHKANRIKPQEDREPSSVLTSAVAPSKILPAQSTLGSLCRSSNPKYNRTPSPMPMLRDCTICRAIVYVLSSNC